MPFIGALGRDVRYALRQARKAPGFALTVVGTLALTFGANAAVFSLVDAVLLRPLPYPAPGDLAMVSTTVTSAERGAADTLSQTGRTWQMLRDEMTTADLAVISTWVVGVSFATDRTAFQVDQQRVGAGYFRVLGVPPAAGREFEDVEDRPGGPPLAILSHSLWQRAFGGRADILGESIVLRGEAHAVIGVMPERFHNPVHADVWTPLRATTTGEGAGENYQIVGRVKASQWERASAEVASVGQAIAAGMRLNNGTTVRFGLLPLQRALAQDLAATLVLLWSAVGAVLLVACVNIAGLLLARSASRRREIATRLALGAGRPAVVRQLIVESVVLGAAGAAAGLFVGALSLDVLRDVASATLGVWQPVTLDLRVVAAMAAVSIGASVVIGCAPAIQSTRLELTGALALRGMRATGRSGMWSRRILVASQVALSLGLLVGAALLVRTFLHLGGLAPGFDSRNVVTASVSLQDARYATAARVSEMFDRSLEQIRRIPGVETAGISLGLPYERLLNMGFVLSPGARGSMTTLSYVTPGYFETLRIAPRLGRMLRETDTATSPYVVIVNETFVRTYLPETPPVGWRLRVAGQEREIVGVVGDVQQRRSLGEGGPLTPMPMIYMPASQTNDAQLRLVHTWFAPVWVVRTAAPAEAVVPALRRAMQEVDPQLPFGTFKSMDEVRSDAVAPQRLLASLVGVLAAAAVLLAIMGLHGLIASSVVERTRELGIRLALGSSAGKALRAVVAPGLALSIAGIAAGCALALAASRLLGSLVWGVSATDPLTYIAAALAIFAVTVVASVVPALRVLSLDPAQTLRQE